MERRLVSLETHREGTESRRRVQLETCMIKVIHNSCVTYWSKSPETVYVRGKFGLYLENLEKCSF